MMPCRQRGGEAPRFSMHALSRCRALRRQLYPCGCCPKDGSPFNAASPSIACRKRFALQLRLLKRLAL